MSFRSGVLAAVAAAMLIMSPLPYPIPACGPVGPSGKPVVNADQTVIIIWDAVTKTEHFIRQATFKSDADDFGFLVPTPSQPELDESGNEAFPYLRKLTQPDIRNVSYSREFGCGCGAAPKDAAAVAGKVTVLTEKLVAGFHAVVLESGSASSLVAWLKDHGYAFSPEVEAWARPYVEGGWKITALKVAKEKDMQQDISVAASSLRMSFKTDKPLFPYREPDPRKAESKLNAKQRLLRIYFLADGRYRGGVGKDMAWGGSVAWANPLGPADRMNLPGLLKLPMKTVPENYWLTEFEDNWPYEPAPGDLYFSRDVDQTPVKRPPIIRYVASPLPTDITVLALATLVVLLPLVRRFRRTA
jgi:hypothetical protein